MEITQLQASRQFIKFVLETRDVATINIDIRRGVLFPKSRKPRAHCMIIIFIFGKGIIVWKVDGGLIFERRDDLRKNVLGDITKRSEWS